MRKLILVHGRAQENKDSVALKAEWIASFREGLQKSGLDLPIPEADIRFPYYGQTLHDLTGGASTEDAARVIVRGDHGDPQEETFAREVFHQLRARFGITDEQLREIDEQEEIERGIQNWEWVQTVLKAIDRHVPGASGAAVAIATSDVYQYLNNAGLRGVIDDGVRQAFEPGVESVVVGHSLGSVVAYNLLKNHAAAAGWTVPLFVTVGSPLGIEVIRKSMHPLSFPARVGAWYNAMDERDVVALYPLTAETFPVQTPIENKTNVNNHTENRHGIAGYLNDADVARRIHDALVQP